MNVVNLTPYDLVVLKSRYVDTLYIMLGPLQLGHESAALLDSGEEMEIEEYTDAKT